MSLGAHPSGRGSRSSSYADAIDGQRGSSSAHDPPSTGSESCFRRYYNKTKLCLSRHAAFVGPGIVASVAYADPGNWATDLEAGASHGYKLLFAVLLSGLFAILLQVLACRLGIVTGMDLACSTRQLILGPFGSRAGNAGQQAVHRPKWEKWLRWGSLWAIYLIAEAAIVATELAELIGSAIALNLLFPKLPLWGGVLVTSADVFLILFVYRPNGGLRAFEVLIGTLVIIVLGCYIVLLVRVKPDWGDAFEGYLPSSTLLQHDALYIAVGILGATVMPHGLFLGSHFSTVDRLNEGKRCPTSAPEPMTTLSRHNSEVLNPAEDEREAPKTTVDRALAMLVRRFPRIDVHAFSPSFSSSRRSGGRRSVKADDDNMMVVGSGPRIPDMDPDKLPDVKLDMVKVHLPHASIDIALSLLAFAITINSAILIVAAAATAGGERDVGDLFQAFDLLKTTVGNAAAVLFAIALLAAGQSASLTVCLAGQIISEGFIRWKTSPLTRRILTRVIAMVPSLIVASAVGKDGVDALLVGSQVVLSMALPFVTAPLLIITGLKSWMRVWEDNSDSTATTTTTATANDTLEQPRTSSSERNAVGDASRSTEVAELSESREAGEPVAPASASVSGETEAGGKWHHFQNWWPVAVLGWAVFGVIVAADVFTLVTL
ncbi:Manganese transporter smf1 [Tilletia horrida]|uniref:Manganese transporter smf1 n=1 Tax=Tilletia horrida TaxID=155126 RepID=A0AAN6GWW5_9BASI|nr:Manganese transporter smf1 [Tilletia horrida]